MYFYFGSPGLTKRSTPKDFLRQKYVDYEVNLPFPYSAIYPAIDGSLAPLLLHIHCAVPAHGHTAHSNFALPDIFITILFAIFAQYGDLHMLLDTGVSLQVRPDLETVDNSFVRNLSQIDWVEDMATVDTLMLLEGSRELERIRLFFCCDRWGVHCLVAFGKRRRWCLLIGENIWVNTCKNRLLLSAIVV
jgi:hypothetical protein